MRGNTCKFLASLAKGFLNVADLIWNHLNSPVDARMEGFFSGDASKKIGQVVFLDNGARKRFFGDMRAPPHASHFTAETCSSCLDLKMAQFAFGSWRMSVAFVCLSVKTQLGFLCPLNVRDMPPLMVNINN